MLFAAMVLGTALFYILQERFRKEPDTPAARILGRSFGVKPSGPGGKYTRRERLRAALVSGAGACAAFAINVGSVSIEQRITDLTLANHVVEGVMFVAAMIGVISALAALLHFIAVPFAPASFETRGD